MDDFEMRANPAKNSTGRTYRFHEPGSALWPFGFGKSYSTFEMSWDADTLTDRSGDVTIAAPPSVTTVALAPTESGKPGISRTLTVTNTGHVPAAKVVLAFAAKTDSDDAPRKELIALRKVHLEPGASVKLSFDSDDGAGLGYCAFCTVAAAGKTRSVSAGKYRLSVGDGDNDALAFDFVATGPTVTLPI